MTVRRGVAAPTDTEASFIKGLLDRIETMERIAHVHPSGLVTIGEIPALVIATGDPRWVNVAGDTMTGPLDIYVPVGSIAALTVTGPVMILDCE